jgi:membrane protein DedA with SNARE-associated domain
MLIEFWILAYRAVGLRAPAGRLPRLPYIGGALARWDRLLERHGTRAVFIARLLPLARTFVSLPAGARRMPLIPFIVLTSAGCALWAIAFVLAGVLAGNAWATFDSLVGHLLLGAGALVLAASLLRRRPDR